MPDFPDLLDQANNIEANAAKVSIFNAAEEDPDQAARAVTLEQDTGVPAPIIHGDQDNFERQYKAQLSAGLIQRNRHLAEYVNSHPMAAAVSHDDLAQLDVVSQTLKQYGAHAVLDTAVRDFKDAFDKNELDEEHQKLVDLLKNNPYTAPIAEQLGTEARDIAGMMRAMGAGAAGVAGGVGELFHQLGMSEAGAHSAVRDVFTLLQVGMAGPMVEPGFGMHPKVRAEFDRISPHLLSGEPIPPGVSELADEAIKEQTKSDAKSFKKLEQEASKLPTLERSDELFKDFIRLRSQQNIGIPEEMVRKLYGDKAPAPEDGLLGDVPGIEQQLAAAASHGGDVQIPIEDWLVAQSKNPELRDVFKDDIRFRPNGMTLNEIKEAPTKAGMADDGEEVIPHLPPNVHDEAVSAVQRQGRLDPTITEHLHDDFATKAGWIDFGEGVSAFLHPREEYTRIERELTSAVSDELNRIVPRKVEKHDVHSIYDEGRNYYGMYIKYDDRIPVILYSLTAPDPIGTGWHEAIHHLKRQGFFTPEEWQILAQAADKNEWRLKHDIPDRYPKASYDVQLEEAVAEEFRTWMHSRQEIPTTPWGHLMERLLHMVDFVGQKVKDLLGIAPTFDELFERVDKGEIGSREGKPTPEGAEGTAGKAAMAVDTGEPPDLGPAEIFERGAAFGRSQLVYNRYKNAIDRWVQANQERQRARALKDEKRRQTGEWKENETRIADEVRTDIQSRPDVAAYEFFRTGKLYGRSATKIPKLDPKLIDAEQRALLPAGFLKAGTGVGPDDLAGLFGYTSGKTMMDDIMALQKVRGGSPMKTLLDKVVKAETERRMQKEYGDLKENIIAGAEDHVLSPGQMEFMHEQTMLIGQEAGLEMPYTKPEMQEGIRGLFDQTPIGLLNPKTFLNNSGRAGKKIEENLLGGNIPEAFKQAQLQEKSTQWAKLAKDLEKLRDKFDRLAKKYSKRDVTGTATDYVNFIHDILNRVMPEGFVKRSPGDLARAMETGGYKDINHFVQSRFQNTFGMDTIPVADFLLNPSWRKPLEQLTAEEFRELHNSIAAMDKRGRGDLKLTHQGNEYVLQEQLDTMKEELRTFPLKKYDATATWLGKVSKLPKVFLAANTAIETLMNRWDRQNPLGPFNRFVVYPLASAANRKNVIQREIAKPYRELGKPPRDKVKLDSPLIDPNTIIEGDPTSGEALSNFTHGNVQVMIHNAGNPYQWNVLAKGWGQDPAKLMDWLKKNSTKDQWVRAEKMGGVFHNLFKQAEDAYYDINGIQPARIELTPFEVELANGEKFSSEGWYHPLIPDPDRPFYFDAEGKKISGRTAATNDFDGPDNFHARTTNGYTKSRTGAIYPIDLNPDMIPIRMTQMIHDIAFRKALIDVEKVFRDPSLRSTIIKNYGAHYEKGLMPYLRGIAGEEGISSEAYTIAKRVSEYLRQNTIGAYIGFNPGTALKHGPTALVLSAKQVGTVPFMKALWDLNFKSEADIDFNKKWIDEHFEEVARRQRHWDETLAGVKKDLYGEGTTRERMLQWGSWLVAQSDMFSVRATALAEFRKELERQNSAGEEVNLGQGIELGERAVRFAHGSTAITNQTAMVRGGGPIHGWLTSIYGFFGTVMQRRIEFMHVLNDTYQLGKAGEIREAANKIPDLMGRAFAHFVWPIMVEEWVTSLTTDDRRGWGSHLFFGAMQGLASSVLYLRDIMYAFSTGHDPNVGLVSSPLHDAANLIHDISKGERALSGPQAARTVKDFITVFGEVTGTTPKIFGTAAQYGMRLQGGYEREPTSLGQLYRGITRGVSKPRIVR